MLQWQVLLQVPFGQQLAIVGSCEQLGSWEVASALSMGWDEGHVWRASLELPAGAAIEFKFVQHMPNRRASFPDPHH